MDPVREVRMALDEIRPELIAMGGDIRLVDVVERVAQVTLSGPFTRSCHSKRSVLSRLERHLRARLPWLLRVDSVCPAPGMRAR